MYIVWESPRAGNAELATTVFPVRVPTHLVQLFWHTSTQCQGALGHEHLLLQPIAIASYVHV